MYQLTEKFNLYDANFIPHSLSPEKHSAIDNLHASVDERGFNMKSIGNRWIVNTPLLKDFALDFTFSYTYLAEYNPCTYVFFGYDRRTRCGQAVKFRYNLTGSLEVTYVKVNRMKVEEISDKLVFDNFTINENENVDISIKVKGDALKGVIGGCEFAFAIESARGHIAFERKNFVGEWIIHQLNITSEEDFPVKTVLPEKTVLIPMRDGGDIPYEFTYKAETVGNQCYLTVELGGGTASRELNRDDRPGQYIAEQDRITSPFVILRNGEKKKEFNLYHGSKIICDPNIFWECLKDYFNHPEMPIKVIFPIDEADISEHTTISFGYEEMRCTGYMAQAGGPSEFIYDINGNLIYEGDALGESIFELYSPADKFATTLIPEDTYKREDVIKHLAGNHYFHVDEKISLEMSMKTLLTIEYFSVKAEIRDVYDNKTLAKLNPEISIADWKFGYCSLSAKVENEPLPLGVYRIVFTVYYGENVYKTYNKVFEVFDKDAKTSPALASGLPFTFSMPNEQKWLASNTFDLWNPKPSCDDVHFISCATNTPVEAERQRIWELLPIFGRKWYVWLNSRVCLDWKMEDHPDVVKNCDYLYTSLENSFYVRVTSCLLSLYQSPKFREHLHEFLEKNPEIAKKLTYTPAQANEEYVESKPIDESEKDFDYKTFTYDNLKNFLETCHTEWFDFIDGRLHEMARLQNETLRKINPKVKRAFYGPFCLYGLGTVSYHTVRAFGYNPGPDLAKDVFTGFAVFEDYPSACAYQTYRGAFAVMTLMLHCPGLVLYPEQYNGSDGGCIDGAVKFAYAPMGKYDTPAYFNSTHSFEFAFNTPYRTEDGYHYWTSYGFHRRDHLPEEADKLSRDWKNVVLHSPKKPLRSMAMVTEYFDEEDVFLGEVLSLHSYTEFSNVSEESHGYIYECAREAGLNAPFALKYETLSLLSKEECDVLVIPTLKYASDEAKNEIRRLYEEGVSLVAVSDVCGLEDIFGVKEYAQQSYITELSTDDESEFIYPNEAPFKYEANGAEAIMTADNKIPVILKHGKALLINAPISRLGHECFEGREGITKNNVSELLRKTLKKELADLSSPLVSGKNVGITLFETKDGRKMLLAIDYSPYDNIDPHEKEAVVTVNEEIFKDAISEREILTAKANGYIKELRFNINPHESVFIELV